MNSIQRFINISHLVRYLYINFIPDEIHKLFYVFAKKDFGTIYSFIRKDTSTDLYRWNYIILKYPKTVSKYNILKKTVKYDINIIKLAVYNGLNLSRIFCKTNDLTTAIYLLDQGAAPEGLFSSDNLEVVLYTRNFVKGGKCKDSNIYWQLFSQNKEVFILDNLFCRMVFVDALKYTTNMEIINHIKNIGNIKPDNWSNLYFNDNIEFVNFAYSMGAKKFNNCLCSNNMEIFKFGLNKGAAKMNYALYSNNLDIVKIAIEGGANKFKKCYKTTNIDIIMEIQKYHVIDLKKLIEKTNSINILLFACNGLKHG